MRFKIKKTFFVILSVLLVASFSVVSISATTYYYADNFQFFKNSFGGITISECTSEDIVITVPEKLIDYTVTAIGSYAFNSDENLTSITIPDTVVSIGAFAFSKCYSLNDISFNSSNLKELVIGAFQNCDSFVNIDLSKTSITEISDQLFYKCDNIETVILPNTVESIGVFSFNNCPKLSKVFIPESVTKISSNSFDNSSNVVIHCYEESYAHTYAIEKNIPFVLLKKITYELGDIDLSGGIDIKDATLIQKYLASITTLDDTQFGLADYNGDGQVNIMDATAIQKYLVS